MTKHGISEGENHARLSAVFAARRARLASELARDRSSRRPHEPRRVDGSRSIATLQAYGYPLAVGVALTAALPTVVRLLLRQRTLLFKLLMAIFRVRKLRTIVAPRSLGRPS